MTARMYEYTGSINEFGPKHPGMKQFVPETQMVIGDMYHPEVAPIRLDTTGALAAYIDALYWTDDEERYLNWVFHYDFMFQIQYIEIPAAPTDDGCKYPAKIISFLHPADNHMDQELKIFGPQEHISTRRPQPMSSEQYWAWRKYYSDTINGSKWYS